MYTIDRYCMLINAQSASLCSLLAAESTAAETNAASSFDRSPAMDQIYQISIFFISFKLSNTTVHSHRNVC